MKVTEQPLIKRERYDDGADWTSLRGVLARLGKIELQHWYAGKSWTDRLNGTQPFKASLILVNYTSRRHDWKTICEESRLSKAFFAANAEVIDKAMGMKIAHLLHPRKTIEVILEEPKTTTT